MLVSRISPAPRSTASRAHATTSRPVGVRPPARYASQPSRRRRPARALASIASTTHCAPNTSASSSISSGRCERGGVDRHLVGARVEHRLGVGDRADAAADRERDEHLVGGAARQLGDRVALLVRGGDVEEHELVGALAVVVGGQLDGIAGVADVDEFDALDDAAGVDVQAGDDALVVHRSTVARRARRRSAQSRAPRCASATVKRRSYSALPTITPSRLSSAARGAARRAARGPSSGRCRRRRSGCRSPTALATPTRPPRRSAPVEHPVAVDVREDELAHAVARSAPRTRRAASTSVGLRPAVRWPPRRRARRPTRAPARARARRAPPRAARGSVKAAVPRITRAAPAASASRDRLGRAQPAAVLHRHARARRRSGAGARG